MTLTDRFASGELLHPVDRDIPNTVDLFRAVALASGDVSILDWSGTTDHVVSVARRIGTVPHLVVIIADGLGIGIADAHLATDGWIRRSLAGELRAVYPSTTAVALTAIASASWPAQHGLTGWWTRFPSIGRTLAILPFVEMVSGTAAREFGIEAADLIHTEPAWPGSLREVRVVLPKEISEGSYNEWFHLGVGAVTHVEMTAVPETVGAIVAAATRPTLTYVYLPVVDSVSHEHGPYADPTGDAARAVDAIAGATAGAVAAASGNASRVILTADHGHIATPSERELLVAHDDELARFFAAPPSGDVRSAQLWLRPGTHLADVREAIDARLAALGATAHLIPTDELIESGVLGPVSVADAVRERWGDATLLALGDASFEYTAPNFTPKRYAGNHSGLSPEEMRVPLAIG